MSHIPHFPRTGWSRLISDTYLKSVTKLSKQCLPGHKGMTMLRRPRIGPNSYFQYWSTIRRNIYISSVNNLVADIARSGLCRTQTLLQFHKLYFGGTKLH